MSLPEGTLQRMDTVPALTEKEVNLQLYRWLMQLVDTLNGTITQIERLL